MDQLCNHNPTTDPLWVTAESLGENQSMADFEMLGYIAAVWQRYANWNLGDVARLAARRWPDTWMQCFPEWMSPDHIARCKAVAEAYKPEERSPLASWSIHMRYANRPNRVQLVQWHVDQGHTSDEARTAKPDDEGNVTETPEKGTMSPKAKEQSVNWLLAVDVNYFVNKFFFSGSDVAAGYQVANWLRNLIGRPGDNDGKARGLMAKGLTHAYFCFDAPTNFRKALTADWDKPYKGSRPPKETEVKDQIEAVRKTLESWNFQCVSVADMEADDLLASYAAQFDGRVSLLTADKDARQSLSPTVNILSDKTWDQDQTSGQYMPVYRYTVAHWPENKPKPENVSCHFTDGCTYSGTLITGIRPDQWADFQAIAGDSGDDIAGATGIGAHGAMDLIHEFGSLDAAVAAAKNPPASQWVSQKGPRGGQQWRHETTGEVKKTKTQPGDRSKTWAALLKLAEELDVTKQLVTMRTDLHIPLTTKL